MKIFTYGRPQRGGGGGKEVEGGDGVSLYWISLGLFNDPFHQLSLRAVHFVEVDA